MNGKDLLRALQGCCDLWATEPQNGGDKRRVWAVYAANS